MNSALKSLYHAQIIFRFTRVDLLYFCMHAHTAGTNSDIKSPLYFRQQQAYNDKT